MYLKYPVFFRSGLLMTAALGCCATACGQVVIHPEWIVAYAFSPTTVNVTASAETTEPAAFFGSLVFAQETRNEFEFSRTASVIPPAVPGRGDAFEFTGFDACCVFPGLGDASFRAD